MGIVRAETIARMRGAIEKGISASRFIRDMREIGLGYRRADMLADYRSETEAKEKDGLLRFVRKDRYPAERTIAAVDWAVSKEYMYKAKVQTILRPGEPITERFVNVMSDIPMTPAMIEAEVEERWGDWPVSGQTPIVTITPWSAVRKVME